MTQKVGTQRVRIYDQSGRLLAGVMATYQNSDAVVRLLARCALAAFAFPVGLVVKLFWV